MDKSNAETSSHADDTESLQPEAVASTGSRAFGRMAPALMALVACCSVTMIVLLVGAWGYRQLGTGGLMSDVRVGRPAPDFELPVAGGETIKLSDFRGQPVALNFWASWCAACVTELPILDQVMAEYSDDDLLVLAVNNWDREDEVQEFLASRGLSTIVPLDTKGEVNELYSVQSLPTTVWIDRNGIVRAVHIGVLSEGDLVDYADELTRIGADP